MALATNNISVGNQLVHEVCSGLDRTLIEFNGWPSLGLPWDSNPLNTSSSRDLILASLGQKPLVSPFVHSYIALAIFCEYGRCPLARDHGYVNVDLAGSCDPPVSLDFVFS